MCVVGFVRGLCVLGVVSCVVCEIGGGRMDMNVWEAIERDGYYTWGLRGWPDTTESQSCEIGAKLMFKGE